MADNNMQRTSTSTQIRNLYSDEMCYLNISFFNANLSLRFYPFLNKDSVGRSTYDLKNGQNTTVNFEGAFALYQTAKDIIDGKVQEVNLQIPCAGGANLQFDRRMEQNGQMETYLTIMKNNVTIAFRFPVIFVQVKENGKNVTKTVESGLGAFMKTVEGYLTGINADRHLDKLTEEYAKLQNGQGGQPQNNFRQGGGQQQNWQKRPYNGGGYKKSYGGGQQRNGGNGGWQGSPNQQNMSSYNIPN